MLRAFAGWTIWVWGVRIWNIVGDETQETSFKVVHAALALVSVLFAVATLVVVSQVRRRAAAGALVSVAPEAVR